MHKRANIAPNMTKHLVPAERLPQFRGALLPFEHNRTQRISLISDSRRVARLNRRPGLISIRLSAAAGDGPRATSCLPDDAPALCNLDDYQRNNNAMYERYLRIIILARTPPRRPHCWRCGMTQSKGGGASASGGRNVKLKLGQQASEICRRRRKETLRKWNANVEWDFTYDAGGF